MILKDLSVEELLYELNRRSKDAVEFNGTPYDKNDLETIGRAGFYLTRALEKENKTLKVFLK